MRGYACAMISVPLTNQPHPQTVHEPPKAKNVKDSKKIVGTKIPFMLPEPWEQNKDRPIGLLAP